MFSITLTTLAMSLMGWRGVTIPNVYIANFFFTAGFGMCIAAQWEMAIGNGFAYTTLVGFGEFLFDSS